MTKSPSDMIENLDDVRAWACEAFGPFAEVGHNETARTFIIDEWHDAHMHGGGNYIVPDGKAIRFLKEVSKQRRAQTRAFNTLAAILTSPEEQAHIRRAYREWEKENKASNAVREARDPLAA